MIYIPRWKVLLILGAILLSLAYAAPNLLSQETRDRLAQDYPGWMPVKGVSLGLDLRGGSHLLLQVDLATVEREKMDDLAASIRQNVQKENLPTVQIATSGIVLTVTPAPGADAEKTRAAVFKAEEGLMIDSGEQPGSLTVQYGEATWKQIRSQVLSQSIEIVRRRVDESGTRESTIVRQGEDRVLIQIPGLDNPQRIKDLLGRTAKLSFHLVDDAMTPGVGSKTLPLQESPGQSIAIKRRAMLTGDMLVQAQPNFQDGAPVVSFRLNGTGTRRFCDVTKQNTGKPFAIVLDNVVISAPRINEPICGGSAVISGHFSVQEASDLALLLRAGALPAPLKVIEERTVGPSLGSDSVAAGKLAGLAGLLFVMGIMIWGYGLFGTFAALGLLVNVVMIFAVLSLLGATLTLPGIAGIVLTIGMAVDANVLIFERIREEIRAGKTPVAAIDAGYSRAMATIVDSNLTTLIAALVLFLLGAGPIKGFAITLSIGILTSIFSAVMVTRLIVVTWFRRTRPATLTV